MNAHAAIAEPTFAFATDPEIAAFGPLMVKEAAEGHFTGPRTTAEMSDYVCQLQAANARHRQGVGDRVCVFAIRTDDTLVGLCVLMGVPEQHGMELSMLLVHPTWRNRGIGRVAVKWLMSQADGLGQRLQVNCRPASIEMMGLVSALGFKEAPGVPGKGRQFLSLPLPGSL